jgi:hypothetical protein
MTPKKYSLLSLCEEQDGAKFPKIMVDGVLRHENNSLGKPIYSTYEGIHNFWKWFGKSIVVDKHGRPEIFYHGTSKDIKAFSNAYIGKGVDAYGIGHYFINDTYAASNYSTTGMQDENYAPNVKPVYIKMEKPIKHSGTDSFTAATIKKIITAAPNHKEKLSNFGDISYEGYQHVLHSAVSSYEGIPKFNQSLSLFNDFYKTENAADFVKVLQSSSKHDGVLTEFGNDRKILTVFDPRHIKSALGNNGKFSKRSHNLTEHF